MTTDMGFLDVDVPEAPAPAPSHEDVFPTALKVAWVGVGQAGGRFADAAWALGWRKVLALNTAQEDLGGLVHLPQKRRFLYGDGGAGKDPEHGRRQFARASGDVLELMRQSFGDDVDLVLVVASGAGGTGCGSVIASESRGVIDVARAYASLAAPRAPAGEPRVGAMLALPERSEGVRPAHNAARALRGLFDRAAAGDVSPLVLIENERVTHLWPSVNVLEMWPKANTLVLNTLQAFLALSTKDGVVTFDREDLRRTLGSGVMAFGMAEVGSSGLGAAVRAGTERGLLATGLDLSKAQVGAMLVAGPKDALGQLGKDEFDRATAAFSDAIGGGTVHRGLYEAPLRRLRAYVMVGGLPFPSARYSELSGS